MNRAWSDCDFLGFPFLPVWVVGNRHVGVAGASFAGRRGSSRVRSVVSAFAAALTWWALHRGGAPGPGRFPGWPRPPPLPAAPLACEPKS
jgi:hypothetical protein